jgi:transposase
MSALEQALGGPAIEVVAKAARRRFTVEYKRKIVREADACKTPGTVGALLRREGLYSSHLTTWRAARERGELAGAAKKRGPLRRCP